MTPQQTRALEILAQIHAARKQLEDLNATAETIFGNEFPPYTPLMPDSLFDKIVGLLGEVLEPGVGEHNIAAYFLWECDRSPGRITLPDGREYVISTIEDVRRYVEETV